MSHYRSWLLQLIIVLAACSAHAQRGMARAQDSLARLYVSATQAGSCLIVDQGRYKAIFDANGRPLTQFSYKALRPGLEGRFLAQVENQTLLIDSVGNELAVFDGILQTIDSTHAFYRTRDHQAMRFFNADGSLSATIPLSNGSNPPGPYVWTVEGSGLQGVIDSLNRSVVPLAYHSVQINDAGIIAMKGDSVYSFDRAGRLRFRRVAAESKLLTEGSVAVQLYGLWGMYDSSGDLLLPFTAYSFDAKSQGRVTERNGKLIDPKGHELSTDHVSYVENEPGGWSLVHYEGGNERELRDAALNVVLPKGSFGQLRFIGPRFIIVFAGYNDPAPRVYDRSTRTFTSRAVERHLAGDAYLLYDAKSKSRQVMLGDSVLPLPRFTRLDPVKDHPYFQIAREDSGVLAYLQTEEEYRPRRSFPDLLEFRRAPVVPHGLLDSAMRLVVPLKASEIRLLTPRLIFAPGLNEGPGAIYTAAGAVLIEVPDGNTVSIVQNLIRIAGPAGATLCDTLGRIIYRAGESPAILVPDGQSARERAAETLQLEDQNIYYPAISDLMHEALLPEVPMLLLYDDSSGYSGLYDIAGRQLLPHAYYPVAQRIPGLHTLKKGDSLYFVNAHGRLMYGGRGFRGQTFAILENYSMILRDGTGRWGIIDALGRNQLPYEYDSVLSTWQDDRSIQYTLVQKGRYGVLDRSGKLMYPMQSWKPERWITTDRIYANNRQYYRLIDGDVVRVPADSVWGKERKNRYIPPAGFIVRGAEWGAGAGIYSRGGRLLAPWYSSFDYRERGRGMLITNAARNQVAVIDTNGDFLLPFTDTPPALVLSDSAILLIDTGSRWSDLLVYADGRQWRRVTVRVDSASRAPFFANGRRWSMYFSSGETVTFQTRKGQRGIVNAQGRVLIDPKIEEIRSGGGVWRIRRAGRWGTFLPWEMQYASPPDADSIIQEAQRGLMLIRKGGKEGIYDPQHRLYLPPVYDRIFQPRTLSNGYLVVRTSDGYRFINRWGEQISPLLDSLDTAAPTIPTTAAFSGGEEVSLAIDTDARIMVERGMAAKIRRAGIHGSFAPVVVLRSEAGFGLYSNEQFRMILPAHYDAIDASEQGFVVWKYKPDKHQGMDSTILAASDGQVIRAMNGGFNPKFQNGFWFLRGIKVHQC